MTNTDSFGSSLRSIRESRNLSLRQIEEVTGISNAYLSQLENGKIKKPSPHFLQKLASLYDVEFEKFLEAAGYLRPKEKKEGPKTLAGAALFSTKDLTAEEEAELMKYLQYLRSKQGKQ